MIISKLTLLFYIIDTFDISITVQFNHPKHGNINLAQYYEKQYDIKLKDPKQPLLISMPKAKDKRAGMTEPIKLIPELCLMTGLTDRQRNDFRLMQELSAQLRMDPQQRLTTIRGFGQKMLKADSDSGMLKQWGMSIDAQPIKLGARIFQPESIEMGPMTQSGEPRKFQYPIQDADWTNSLKDGKYSIYMHHNIFLEFIETSYITTN